MSHPRRTRTSGFGTSFHDSTISTTPRKLKQLFPVSYQEDNTGKDKVNIEFVLETSTGQVFTIYDWKMYRPYNNDEVIEFHIGGHRKEVTEEAKKELEEMLNSVPVEKDELQSLKEENEKLRKALKPFAELDMEGVNNIIIYQRNKSFISVNDVLNARKLLNND